MFGGFSQLAVLLVRVCTVRGERVAVTGVVREAGWCVAVGMSGSYRDSRAFVEVLRDGAWQVQATPTLAGVEDAELTGVSCTSTSHCVAWVTTSTRHPTPTSR